MARRDRPSYSALGGEGVTNHIVSITLEAMKLVGDFTAVMGTFMMANGYLGGKLTQIPLTLLSSLYRGGRAQRVAKAREIVNEKVIVTLQGLSLIALGFFLQLLPEAVGFLDALHIPLVS